MNALERIQRLLAKYAKVEFVSPEQSIFDGGLDMSSIAFTEFVLEVEEEFETDIDPDLLDQSIKTVGQLTERLVSIVVQP